MKSPDEIAIIQESCAIGDAVTRRAIDATREGRRENEIAGDAMQTLYYLGGEMAHVITPFVASGEHMSPPHRICTDKIVRNGDLCFIDIGAMWNGYFADIGRTIDHRATPTRCRSASTPSVYEGLMAGIATMRPGNTNQDTSDAIIAKVAEHGFGDNLFSLFIGHGIGMGANEPPYIGETLPGSTVVESSARHGLRGRAAGLGRPTSAEAAACASRTWCSITDDGAAQSSRGSGTKSVLLVTRRRRTPGSRSPGPRLGGVGPSGTNRPLMRRPAVYVLGAATVAGPGANWPIMSPGVDVMPPRGSRRSGCGGAAIAGAGSWPRAGIRRPDRADLPILLTVGSASSPSSPRSCSSRSASSLPAVRRSSCTPPLCGRSPGGARPA